MTIDDFIKKLEQATREEFQQEFLVRVQDKTPVRTGALRAGWFWDISSGNANNPVFTNTEYYAEYVENGTPKMAPHLMVATTCLEVDDIMKVALSRAGL